jgi:DNA-binding IclR family transcriptional regulator
MSTSNIEWTEQLSIATGLHRTTIPKLIYELNKAGLIDKSGGRFSLKQL